MAKRKIDEFDLQAEREGGAIRGFNSNYRLKRPTGKRIAKQRQQTNRGDGIIQNRIEKRHVL